MFSFFFPGCYQVLAGPTGKTRVIIDTDAANKVDQHNNYIFKDKARLCTRIYEINRESTFNPFDRALTSIAKQNR